MDDMNGMMKVVPIMVKPSKMCLAGAIKSFVPFNEYYDPVLFVCRAMILNGKDEHPFCQKCCRKAIRKYYKKVDKKIEKGEMTGEDKMMMMMNEHYKYMGYICKSAKEEAMMYGIPFGKKCKDEWKDDMMEWSTMMPMSEP